MEPSLDDSVESNHGHVRVEQKVHERGFLCEGPGVCHDHVWLKFFLKLRNNSVDWQRFGEGLCMWYVYSLDKCSKACLPGRKAMATPNTWLLYLLLFPWYQGPGHFVNASVNLKNVPIYFIIYRFIFRESWAKVLLKRWRKTAFTWRLGGLNCGLAKTSLQEVSTAVWAWKCQNWPMKVSKDQNTTVCKNIKSECAAITEKLRWLICPSPVRYSPDVPLKLNMHMAKVWRKNIFYSAKMSLSAWKNLEQPSCVFTAWFNLKTFEPVSRYPVLCGSGVEDHGPSASLPEWPLELVWLLFSRTLALHKSSMNTHFRTDTCWLCSWKEA